MIDLKRGIQPGLSAMDGSDESRKSARFTAMAYTQNLGVPNTRIKIFEANTSSNFFSTMIQYYQKTSCNTLNLVKLNKQIHNSKKYK